MREAAVSAGTLRAGVEAGGLKRPAPEGPGGGAPARLALRHRLRAVRAYVREQIRNGIENAAGRLQALPGLLFRDAAQAPVVAHFPCIHELGGTGHPSEERRAMEVKDAGPEASSPPITFPHLPAA